MAENTHQAALEWHLEYAAYSAPRCLRGISPSLQQCAALVQQEVHKLGHRQQNRSLVLGNPDAPVGCSVDVGESTARVGAITWQPHFVHSSDRPAQGKIKRFALVCSGAPRPFQSRAPYQRSLRGGVCTAEKNHLTRQHNVTDLRGDAVIVELRQGLATLPAVLSNFLLLLPAEWTVHLLHLDGAESLASVSLLREQRALGRLKLTRLTMQHGLPKSPDARWIEKNGHAWYTNFIKRATFWRLFSAPRLLLFESDSALCPHPTHHVSYFLDRWLYIGAPWSTHSASRFPVVCDAKTGRLCPQGAGVHWCHKLPCCVGNSGLSLWDRESMAELLEQGRLPFIGAETIDFWAAYSLQELEPYGVLRRHAVAPRSEAMLFSGVEAPHMYVNNFVPFGVHKVGLLDRRGREAIARICPTVSPLLNLTDGAVAATKRSWVTLIWAAVRSWATPWHG